MCGHDTHVVWMLGKVADPQVYAAASAASAAGKLFPSTPRSGDVVDPALLHESVK